MHILHPGANLQPLASRSYASKMCPCVHRFDLKLKKFAVFECSRRKVTGCLCGGYFDGGVCG